MGRRERSGRSTENRVHSDLPLLCALRRRRPLRRLVFLALLSACELTEVTIAPGTSVVVVQSVISRMEPVQFVVVEYSQAGDDPGTFGDVPIPPGNPKRPITGALVTITHGTGGACAGRVDTLVERPPRQPAFAPASGTYAGPMCQPEPGELLLLRVETPAGDVVTGTTTVPGASARAISAGGPAPGPIVAELLNRVQDTLVMGVTPISGKALQVELRYAEDSEDLAFFVFTDSMGIQLPGNLALPSDNDEGESVFRAGRYYTLAVALTDSNYYDFLRSYSDPFTGKGFINHLTGGIGVFGSVETERYRLAVVAPVDDPREGVYRLTGAVDTAAVDVTLELYVDDLQPDRFSTFVRGNWRGGAVDVSVDGFSPRTHPTELHLVLNLPRADSLAPGSFALDGARAATGGPFPFIVHWFNGQTRVTQVDTLTAQQISGPGIP